MKVQTLAFNRPADPQLLAFIEDKLRQIERFFGRVIEAQVVLRGNPVQESAGAVAEIRITLPGSVLFVREVGQTIENSIERATLALKRQLVKYKDRRKARR